MYRIENFVFLLINLAQTQALPQNTANKLGRSIIATGTNGAGGIQAGDTVTASFSVKDTPEV